MECVKYKDNVSKGAMGELTVRKAFENLGYIVKEHKVEDGGLDIVANDNVGAEVLHWKRNSYPSNSRFFSIVRNLVDFNGAVHCLVAVGARLTSRQRLLFKSYGMHLLEVDSLSDVAVAIRSFLGVVRHFVVVVFCSVLCVFFVVNCKATLRFGLFNRVRLRFWGFLRFCFSVLCSGSKVYGKVML